MITREECEKALNTLQEKYVGFDVVDELIDFKMLIEEHFDNPPLKFEELKEKTWYWHEPSKSWIYLYKPLDWEPIKGLRYGERIIINSVEGYYMDFKEGTLFRKQVKE